jgi:hypothetical protein
MKRSEILWLAFEKFAIFFSFMVTFILVMILLVVAFVAWQAAPMLLDVKDGIVCDTITGLNTLLVDFEDAVITRTIYISQTIPVQFDLPLDQSLTVKLTDDVPISRPATYVLPSGGGRINGTVHLDLPEGQKLPIHMRTTVGVDEELPVEMDVDVAIPLRETDLGGVIQQLKHLLAPLRLEELEQTLQCPARSP